MPGPEPNGRTDLIGLGLASFLYDDYFLTASRPEPNGGTDLIGLGHDSFLYDDFFLTASRPDC